MTPNRPDSPDYRPTFVKVAEQLEIDEVVDCRTGLVKSARELLSLTNEEYSKLRISVHEAKAQNHPLLLCAYCLAPIYPAEEVRKINRGAHFRHFHGDGDCPARTRDELSVEAKLALQFNGAKEGWDHRDTKVKLFQSLSVDPNFSNICTEKRWWSADRVRWRQPDIQAIYKGQRVAFEIQLARTYASVIAQRRLFYKAEDAIVIWVFRNFTKDERYLAVEDIFHTNNRNALVVNGDTLKESLRANCFKLECHWPEPRQGGKGEEQWRSELIDFGRLTLEQEKQRAWYFDCEGARALALRAESKEIVTKVRRMLKQFVATTKTKEWKDRATLWRQARELAVKVGADLPDPDHIGNLGRLLSYIFSAEEGRPVGFGVGITKLSQVAFNADDCHRDLLKPFGWALKSYGRMRQLSTESAKWSQRQSEIKAAMQRKDPKYDQDETWYPLLARLFPEIGESGAKTS